MARLMSEAEQRRRQKLQSKIGRTTSTLGLGGLGALGVGMALKKPKVAEAAAKIPRLRKLDPKKLENVALKTGIVSSGIGGVGGFNQASIYSAESRRRKQTVAKSEEPAMEMGYYGEEGKPLTPKQIEAEIEKAWSPVASNFDSEASRRKRSKHYQTGAAVVGGAGGAAAAHHGVQAVKAAKKVKSADVTTVSRDKAGKAVASLARANTYRAIPTGELKALGRHAGKAGIGLAAVGGAAATHSALKRKRQGAWQPYAKSAFGIEHDEVSKLGLGSLTKPLAKPAQAFAAKAKKPTNPVRQFQQGFKFPNQMGAAAAGGTKLNKPTRAGAFVSRNRKPLGAAGVVAGGAGAGVGMAGRKPKQY